MAGVNQLDDMLARANMHDDPIRFVLQHIDAQITRLELLATREPMPQAELDRICRAAAIGSNAQAVALIRAANRRLFAQLAGGWIVTVAIATAVLVAVIR